MNIEELLHDLRISFLTEGHHHCSEGWLQLKDCPFCGSDSYHLGFNLSGKYFVCWRCGGIKTWKVLEAIGSSRSQIKEFLQTKEYLPAKHRPQGTLKEPIGKGPLLPAHKRYLKSRGFDPVQLESDWSLKGIGLDHELPWRIYIPIHLDGVQVSWTTRAIGDRVSQRYISAAASQEAVPHKDCIYGFDNACHSIVVVEGPADAWRVGLGAGALFGTAFTPAQVRLLSRIPFRYILFDNEPLAQRQARKLADQLACFPGETVILECDAEDPGEMKARDVLLLRKTAKLCRV